MADEDLKEVAKEERPSFLKEAKEERKKLETIRDELKTEIENLRQLREEDILSGRAVQPKQVDKPVESAADYLKRVLANKL